MWWFIACILWYSANTTLKLYSDTSTWKAQKLEFFTVLVSGYVECVKLYGSQNRKPWYITIYHTLQCYITYIPQRGALIFTSSVVHI